MKLLLLLALAVPPQAPPVRGDKPPQAPPVRLKVTIPASTIAAAVALHQEAKEPVVAAAAPEPRYELRWFQSCNGRRCQLVQRLVRVE